MFGDLLLHSVCFNVCLSNACMFDKMEEKLVAIFIPQERSLSIVSIALNANTLINKT